MHVQEQESWGKKMWGESKAGKSGKESTGGCVHVLDHRKAREREHEMCSGAETPGKNDNGEHM